MPLLISAVGLPPRDRSELAQWKVAERACRREIAHLRRQFDRLPDEARRFIPPYLFNGFMGAEAIREAGILRVDPTTHYPRTSVELEARARRILQHPLVAAVVDGAIRVGRLDRPNTVRIRARALAALEAAQGPRQAIEATGHVIKLFGKEVVLEPSNDEMDDLSRLADAVKAGLAAGVVDARTGVVGDKKKASS